MIHGIYLIFYFQYSLLIAHATGKDQITPERVLERCPAVGHVEERGLLSVTTTPIVEARDEEVERCGCRALNGGEDEIKEVLEGGLWEKVATEEGGECELEAHGGGGLEAVDTIMVMKKKTTYRRCAGVIWSFPVA